MAELFWTCGLLATSLVLFGCGSEPDENRPTLVEGVEMNGGSDVLISGTVSVVGGCIGLSDDTQSFRVVWPHGTHYAEDDGTAFQLPDGRTLNMGDEFEAGGGWEHSDSPLVPTALPSECADERVAVMNEDQGP